MLTHPCQDLYRMGILYHDDESVQAQDESNSVECEIPVEQIAPAFVLRPSRRSRNLRQRQLQLFLSCTDLGADSEIARLLSPSRQTIQHRHNISTPISIDIPQSLPPHSALESAHGISNSHFLDPAIFDSALGDWTFIQPNSRPDTPLSEPETWILLSDDS